MQDEIEVDLTEVADMLVSSETGISLHQSSYKIEKKIRP